jgi:glycosyltransferase involved in cell wall biosynthesis
VTHDENRGYGAALKTIFREAEALGAEYLVVLDADGQHDAEDVPSLVEPIVAGEADVVIGSRFADGGETDAPYYRRLGLWVINLLTNLSLGTVRDGRIHDTQSGYRAYNASAVDSLAADDGIDDRMSASLDILYHLLDQGFVVREVGTAITYDVDDASSENPLSHGLELVAGIARRTVRNRSLVSATTSLPLRRR